MKTLLSVLVFVIALSCSTTGKIAAQQEKKGQAIEFEYSALTRGSYKKVKITPAGVETIDGVNSKAVINPISTEDWNWLVTYYEDNVAMKGIRLEDLKVPSKKHQYDGALAAVFTIKVAEQVDSTQTFDHGTPAPEISALVSKVIALSGLDKAK